jgi:hypothetical protein
MRRSRKEKKRGQISHNKIPPYEGGCSPEYSLKENILGEERGDEFFPINW